MILQNNALLAIGASRASARVQSLAETKNMKYGAILLVVLSMVSQGCSHTRTVSLPNPTIEKLPAVAVMDAVIGSDDIPTRYYTQDGAPIYTPPEGMVQYPVTRLTVSPDGSVVAQSDGINVTGSLSTHDFHAILTEVKKAEPSHRVKSLRVLDASRCQVDTLTPAIDGDCPNGLTLEMEKTETGWKVTKTGQSTT